MKNILASLIIAFAITSCGEETKSPEPQKETAPPKAIPAALDARFSAIMNDLENHITKDFWGDFTGTTRRGGQGTTERTFDTNAMDAYMTKKGFIKDEKKMMEYSGTIDDIQVNVKYLNATSGEKGGWIQNWEIVTKGSIDNENYEKSKKFSFE